MRLRVFQANHGDCLLLSSRDGHHMLIDGGRSGSFSDHTADTLKDLEALDIVCVSHIDSDHISGVLTLLEAEVDWRIHLHEQDNPPAGRPPKARPAAPKPPTIREIWHNGFSDQLGAEAGDVSSMLSLAASAQLTLQNADAIAREHYLPDLANGEKQAIELTYRIGKDQLDIPLNAHFGGKLARADGSFGAFSLGATNLTLIGPFTEDLKKLQEEWRDWVDANQATLDTLRREMDEEASRFGLSEADSFIAAMKVIASATSEFGNRDDVTTPNLASIMVYAEEDGASILLTGDGAGQDIIKGLKRAGRLADDGQIRVDVLKVQHHGAAANIDLAFLQTIIADHYVFCGNGSHDNPEIGVVERVAASRFGSASKRSAHPDVGQPFTLLFNASEDTANTESRKKHMAKVEQKVADLVGESNGQMTARFNADSFFDIELG